MQTTSLFYARGLQPNDRTYTFPIDESRHITQSLRKHKGERIFITNGKGFLFEGLLESDAPPKRCKVRILSYQQMPTQVKSPLHLAFAPTKSISRTENLIEQITALGVPTMSFVTTQYSERKHLHLERLERIATAAMKQSLQCHLPTLQPLQDLKSFLPTVREPRKYIATCHNTPKIRIKNAFLELKGSCVLVGPEGGFTKQERTLCETYGFQALALTPQRLRTETAGLFIVAQWAAHNYNV